MLAVGEVVGPYRVEAHLATGAMAEVYRVRDQERGTAYALKCLVGGSPRLHRRMEREAKLLQPLEHRNVVGLVDVIDVRGTPGLVMELVEGPTLAEYARDRALPADEARSLFTGVVAGVGHAHAGGMVHRDVKPSNVLLARTPSGLVPKVADFGLAKALDPDEPQEALTASGSSVGSPWYMSPEQVRDPRGVGPAGDVFSLGCVLYELLAGRRAFPGSDPLAVLNAVSAAAYEPLPDTVPADLRAIVARCLRVEPGERYPSAVELGAALRGEVSPVASSASSSKRMWLFAGPPTVARVLVSSGILAAALGAGALIAWALTR